MTKNDNALIQGRDLAEALGLLTRLPMRLTGTRGVAAGWAWPLAGALVGLMAAAVASVGLALNFPATVAAALALATLVIVTGALHEDGLADCADGFWGGRTPEKRLEIMKDSRIGTYGAAALVLTLLIRWSALAALFQAGHVWGPLVAAAAISRVAPLALMGWLPNARPDGLSAGTGVPTRDTVLLAAVVAGIVALLFGGFVAVAAVLVSAIATWLAGLLAQAKLGGQTGDVLGAGQVLAEIAALLVFAAMMTGR